MKIVIVGGGKVGEKLSEELSLANHEITVVELNQGRVQDLMNKYDIDGFIGNGANIELLQELGVEHADIFIGVTESDEINIIACVLAKRLGANYTIARVRNPEYSSHSKLMQQSLDINLIVNPELETAQYIARLLKYSKAISVESFAGDQVNIVEIEVQAGSQLDGLLLKDFRTEFGSVIVCVIHRKNGDIIVPTGHHQLQSGDLIHVTGSTRDLSKFINQSQGNRHINSVLIVGGGRIAYYLLQVLKKTSIFVRLIEVNPERAAFLSQEFPEVEIIVADGTDHDVLDEQNISQFDAFISLTGIDEENLVVSLFAQTNGIDKVITKMNRIRLLNLLQFNQLKSFVTPKLLVADEILQFIRARLNSEGSNVEALYRLINGKVEALQFIVKHWSRITNIPLMELDLIENAIIAYIVRGNQLIFPDGHDKIEEADHIIVVTKQTGLNDIDDLLKS